MDEISQEGISKIIEIAGKRVPSDGKVPPNLRMQLMEALAKLKMDFQTPIEGTIEMASGVCDSPDLHLFSLSGDCALTWNINEVGYARCNG